MKTSRPPTARDVAAIVCMRVVKDRAFAAALLDAELARRPDLPQSERALATELVYGSLRTRGALLRELERHASRGLAKTDPFVLSHLVVAAYQVLLLDRVPAFAAVDTAVAAVRAERGAKVAGFVNAVLRKVASSGKKLDRAAAAVESCPEWLRSELVETVGESEARALLAGPEREGDRVAIRLTASAPVPDWAVGLEPGRVSPRARLVPHGGDLRVRPGFAEGAFVIQEEGAQVVALALGARRGERVLDACAGRGQKTSLLAEQVGTTGGVHAADLHPQKLAALSREFERLRLPPPVASAVDWTAGTGDVPGGFDRVLVDAPCSGTGTLRRRPELLLRLRPEDPSRLARAAEAILRSAASRVKPGGRVVFAVCSVLRDECEGVAGRVADVLTPVPFDAPELSHWIPRGATSLRLLPVTHGTDGFFVASFQRGPQK